MSMNYCSLHSCHGSLSFGNPTSPSLNEFGISKLAPAQNLGKKLWHYMLQTALKLLLFIFGLYWRHSVSNSLMGFPPLLLLRTSCSNNYLWNFLWVVSPSCHSNLAFHYSNITHSTSHYYCPVCMIQDLIIPIAIRASPLTTLPTIPPSISYCYGKEQS